MLGLALVLRVALWLSAWAIAGDTTVFHVADTGSYVPLAEEMLRSGTFSSGGQPHLFRTPGYPLFLVPGVWSGHLEGVTLFLQVLLSVATVWLVSEIAWDIAGSEPVRLLAALLYAGEPLSVMYSVVLLTETLFTATTAAFLWALARHCRTGSWRWLALSGGFLVLSAYVRPISYYLPIPVGLGLICWWFLKGRRSWRMVVHGFAFAVACSLVIGLWQARNAAQTGFGGMSSVSVINLYYYHAVPILAREQGRPFLEVLTEEGFYQPADYFQRYPEQRDWTISARLEFLRKRAVRKILDNPGTFIPLYLKGVIRTLANPGAAQLVELLSVDPMRDVLDSVVDEGIAGPLGSILRGRPLQFALMLLLGGILVQYYIAGTWALWRARDARSGLVLALLVAAYFVAISGGVSASSRFRHPIMPMLAVIAAVGYGEMMARARRP